MITQILKEDIKNKAEKYSTDKWGYSNENNNNYLNDKQVYIDGYLQAIEDISKLYDDLKQELKTK